MTKFNLTSKLRRGLKNPNLIGRYLNRQYYHYVDRSHRSRTVNFIDQDWDNLVILDACRYDEFTKQADLPGKLGHRYSPGSATYEFVRNTFNDRILHDTVYVGANTWFLKLQNKINAEVHHFADLQNGNYDVSWVNEELKVVMPQSVTEHAKISNEEYPNKRLIVHYLQPHHPFIGQIGRKNLGHSSSTLMEVIEAADPNVDQRTIQEAYRENLDIVLKEVEKLLPYLEGRTVITADHGEMLGDRHAIVPTKDYGHPHGIYNDVLTKVPWNVIETNSRKQVTEEKPEQQSESDIEKIDDHLRDLGYVV